MTRETFRCIAPTRSLAIALAMLLSLAVAPAVTTDASAQQSRLTLNQKRVRIDQLVRKIGEAAEQTVLVPDDVRGTVSIVAQRPVEVGEAWQILESSLSMLGFSLLPSPAGTWRVAKVADAVGEAPFEPEGDGVSESFVTTLISLRHAQVTDVLPVLEPLSGSRVTLVPYEATNSLIASGSERSIARLTEIAGELDRIEEQVLRVKTLRYRGVDELEPMVEVYLDGDDRSLARTQVWSDARTNSLAVRGDEAGVADVIDFIDDLDQPIDRDGTLRILRVIHRDPEEVAELIRSVGQASSRPTSPALLAAAGPLDGADFTIAVDPPTRSLVIRATPEVHGVIRTLVETLDVRPQLIAVDVTVSQLRTPSGTGLVFGFQLPFATGDEDDLAGVFLNAPNADQALEGSTIVGRLTRDTDVALVLEDGGVPVPILQTGVFAAADFEAANDVLVQPSLIVTAGEEHEIFVGNTVPIPVNDPINLDGGLNADGTGSSLLTRRTNIERTDVGTTLRVTANAGRRGKIQLELELELTEVDQIRTSLVGAVDQIGPILSERRLTVRARLDDGESAVVASSAQERESDLETGIPFLKDLPFFGTFFRGTAKTRDEIRLIVVARARRVSNPTELVADTIRRRLTFERRAARKGALPRVEGPPYAVRVTTRIRGEDAQAIADSLTYRGHRTLVHRWDGTDAERFDVYVTHVESMVDAASIARTLYDEGWEADLVVLADRD